MKKTILITFSMSTIVLATAVVIMLMLLLPKQVIALQTSIESYTGIEKATYTYVQTKDITKEALLKEYKVSDNDINNFKNTYKYQPGNSDPFKRQGENVTPTTGSGNTSSGTTSNSASAQTAINKTTNSNGGVANPESTSK